MLNGLDLFSGTGGLAKALEPWVEPVAYCEINRYAQGVLLSLMGQGGLSVAPIWDNVRTLLAQFLPPIDLISAGSPCQDFSLCGNGEGLEGEQSSLFWEIPRLAVDLEYPDIFLENVPAICSRGGVQVVEAFTRLGYECRWCVIPAIRSEIGEGERWFLLAFRLPTGEEEAIQRFGVIYPGDTISSGAKRISESPVLRAADDVPHRVDRIKCMGNAVVPLQARTAFQMLMGLKGDTET
jgi:DNA (cytosine-5)-methyltransferase 1